MKKTNKKKRGKRGYTKSLVSFPIPIPSFTAALINYPRVLEQAVLCLQTNTAVSINASIVL
jgi:hypothetical protein